MTEKRIFVTWMKVFHKESVLCWRYGCADKSHRQPTNGLWFRP